MNTLLTVSMFLQLEGPQGGGGMLGFLMPMILIFAIMYFLIFRPQAKKQKQHQAMINAIAKGDKVVTSGGIHGTVAGIKDKENILVVKIAENVKIELSRASVSRKVE